MKKLAFLLPIWCLLACLAACIDDDSNENYLSDYDAGEIKFDTTGVANHTVLLYNLTPGQHVEFEPKVDYKYPERLRYRWFYLTLTNYSYQAQQVGNSLVYPPADTIATTRKLDWTVDLKGGQYRFYLMAEDTITGMRGYYNPCSYTSVQVEGSQGGLYLLTESGENSDIEVLASSLMLIYGGDAQYKKYYSGLTGTTLEGKPKFIRATHTGGTYKEGYMVCTDKNLYRIAQQDMVLMDEWKDMFYTTPDVFNPQCLFFTNYCEFLINNGKLHTLYTSRANDRKFSDAIAGNYEAYPYLAFETKTTWRPVSGAIDADQVIFDQKNKRFVPYFAYNSSVSQFASTSGEAPVDANAVPGEIVKILNGANYYTYVITKINGVNYLYRYNFYNRIDNGDLSAAGNNSITNLSGCTDLDQAKYWTSNSNGGAFYYATDKNVYSFSPTSGLTGSYTLYTCSANEEVTCIYTGGSVGGGWPTSSCILWIAIWDSSKQEGKIMEYEMDHDYGQPSAFWGPMFGSASNPTITTGWQKIVSMTFLDAE